MPNVPRATDPVVGSSDPVSPFFLKLLGRDADGGDMEPVDSASAAWPAPRSGASTGQPRTVAPPPSDVRILPLLPWRIVGAVALATTFALMGWEIKRLVDDEPWIDSIVWWSIVTGVIAGCCVLGWTWSTAENVRRLVAPASTRELPDPLRITAAWLVPFAFIAVAGIVVAYLGEQASRSAEEPVSSIPLVVAVVALLASIPMTYRPLFLLAGLVRQVGGQSARLSQWMWVPVVLALVGVASIVVLRFGGAVEEADGPVDGVSEWAPLWLLGVVAIVPCVIVIVLAWRASATVEEAIELAVARRRGASPTRTRRRRLGGEHPAAVALRGRVRLIPGADLLRLGVVTTLAGLALLSLIGAVVMAMFWLDSDGGDLLPGQRERAWDALGVLHSGARVVGFALVALVTIWTFVAVANVRLASGKRRNPLAAALAWPLAAVGFWVIADRFVIDQPAGTVVVGFAFQAALLYVPFALLERAAEAADTRRTPVRVTYLAGVVLLVYTQALGGVTTMDDATDADVGRVAGFLAFGALLQLLSTLAVTEACRTIENAAEREAAEHNALIDQREAAAERRAVPAAPATPVPTTVSVR